jgi:hypothetical protein
MFLDTRFATGRVEAQEAALATWKRRVHESDARLVVLEVGAGTTIRTMRQLAEDTTRETPGATLVRINLDEAKVPPDLEKTAITIALGALDALTRIDAMIA